METEKEVEKRILNYLLEHGQSLEADVCTGGYHFNKALDKKVLRTLIKKEVVCRVEDHGWSGKERYVAIFNEKEARQLLNS